VSDRTWTPPHLLALGLLSLLVLLGAGILHSNSRVMDRLNAIEDEVKRLPTFQGQAPGLSGTPDSPAEPPEDPSLLPEFLRPRPVPPQGDMYVQGETAEPHTMNYYVTNDALTDRMWRFTHTRLLEQNFDSPQNVIPGLATKWEVSPDKLTYTFQLRPGVRFSDGSPFGADDVLFSYAVVKDAAVKAEHIRAGLVDVVSVEKVDDLTVRVRYAKPYWKGLYTFGYTIRPIPRAWHEKEIPRYAKEHGIGKWSVVPGQPGFAEVFNELREIPPGTGTYLSRPGTSWKTAESLTLYPNPHSWWRRKYPWTYNLAGIQWRFIKDDVAKNEEFRRQGVDVFSCDHDNWFDNLSKDPVIEKIAVHYVYDHVGLGQSVIYWNNRRPPFDDRRVRRAMTMLTDRWAIRDQIERGQADIATCVTKRIYPDYSLDIEPWPFDIEAARGLLAEAGWKDSNGDGVLDRDGKDFEFEYKYPTPRRFYVRVAGFLRDACQRAGIRMREAPIEWSVFYQQFMEQKFDAACLYSAPADAWIDPYEDWHSSQDVPSGNNHPGWRNAEADRLMEEMRLEFDGAKRAALFHRFNRVFHEDQPVTLLVHGKVGVMLNRRFQSVKIRPSGLQPVDFWVKPEDVLHR